MVYPGLSARGAGWLTIAFAAGAAAPAFAVATDNETVSAHEEPIQGGIHQPLGPPVFRQ